MNLPHTNYESKAARARAADFSRRKMRPCPDTRCPTAFCREPPQLVSNVSVGEKACAGDASPQSSEVRPAKMVGYEIQRRRWEAAQGFALGQRVWVGEVGFVRVLGDEILVGKGWDRHPTRGRLQMMGSVESGGSHEATTSCGVSTQPGPQ